MDILKFVIFTICGQKFAMDIRHINSISEMLPITSIPNQNAIMAGVVNLRGIIIPVLNLADSLNLNVEKSLSEGKILIVEHDSLTFGILIGEANQVFEVSQNQIHDTPQVLALGSSNLIQKVILINEEIIKLIEVDRLLSQMVNNMDKENSVC
jgi:purine-binding chemotaxis protein CheW